MAPASLPTGQGRLGVPRGRLARRPARTARRPLLSGLCLFLALIGAGGADAEAADRVADAAYTSEASDTSDTSDASDVIDFVPPVVAECERGQNPTAHATFVETPPEIDGRLDDPAWAQAEPVSELTQVEPIFCTPPSYPSEIRIVTDGETLYLSLRAYDPHPDRIVANRMGRSEIFFFDDNFTILLDTFHDRQNGFFFQVNPNGGRRDATFARDVFEENWDGIWYADARIDERGWTAEVAIPFKTLPFRPGADDWGLQMFRRIRRRNEEHRWADPSRQRFGINISRAGTLTGMAVARQGVGLDVVPTFSVGANIDQLGDTSAEGMRDADLHAEARVEPSFDAFYRVTPGLMVSATANTDFAQTEIDDAQVNLNRFALFFPEKREFFLRDTGIFQFADLEGSDGILPFFSRRIGLQGTDRGPRDVRLLGGGRLTGRAGRFNLGFMSLQQDRNFQSDPPNGLGTDPDRGGENLAVARVSANVLEESTLGLLLTHGDPESDRENLLAGADFNYRSSQLVPGRFVSSNLWIQQDFSGRQYGRRETAWGATLSYPNDRVNWQLRFRDVGRNFDPALGFVNRRDIRRYDAEYRYRWRTQDGLIRTWDLKADGDLTTDRDDNIETVNLFLPFRITSQVDDAFEILFYYAYDQPTSTFYLSDHIGILPGRYHSVSGILRIETSQHRKIRFRYNTGFGRLFGGVGLRIAPLIEWRPSKHFLLSFEYDRRQFWGIKSCFGPRPTGPDRVCNGHSPSFSGGIEDDVEKRPFSIQLFRARFQVNFSPDVGWITLVQWSNANESARARRSSAAGSGTGRS
ncbi:MAG: DUF5916 domain-containing protein, partial [Myxococcota bacterium]